MLIYSDVKRIKCFSMLAIYFCTC